MRIYWKYLVYKQTTSAVYNVQIVAAFLDYQYVYWILQGHFKVKTFILVPVVLILVNFFSFVSEVDQSR